MEENRCKHGILNYVLDDGTEKWVCRDCNPDTEKLNRFRKVIVGDYCDEDTMLHLLETGVLYATVPEHKEDKFCDDYHFIKERDPVWNQYCSHHPGDRKGKFSYDMSIIFDKTEQPLNFNDQLTVAENSDHRKILYSNEFIRYLLKCGFEFGTRHNNEKVMQTIMK
jgi:hypothetical protein